jgi:hypothetical protein
MKGSRDPCGPAKDGTTSYPAIVATAIVADEVLVAFDGFDEV